MRRAGRRSGVCGAAWSVEGDRVPSECDIAACHTCVFFGFTAATGEGQGGRGQHGGCPVNTSGGLQLQRWRWGHAASLSDSPPTTIILLVLCASKLIANQPRGASFTVRVTPLACVCPGSGTHLGIPHPRCRTPDSSSRPSRHLPLADFGTPTSYEAPTARHPTVAEWRSQSSRALATDRERL